MKTSQLLTVAQAARLKKVTTSAIYQAVQSGRLPHQRVLGHIGIEESTLRAWQPVGHRAGRPKGIPVSKEVKQRISESQKRSWAGGQRQTRKTKTSKATK